jgi:hypothetical protein
LREHRLPLANARPPEEPSLGITVVCAPHSKAGTPFGALFYLRNPLRWKRFHASGVVAERLKAAVLKTAKGESPS